MKCYSIVSITWKFIKLFAIQSQKWVVLLRNLLASAEKLCWYPHDDVTVRKPISLSFLQQQAGKKAFHAGDHLLISWSCMFLDTFF